MKKTKFRFAAGFAAFAIAAAPTWAFTWTGGAGNGLMSDPGNWAEANAPSSATDVAAFDLPSDTTVSFDIGASPIIEKSGAGKLTLSGGSAYNGEVRLYGGALDLGGGKATIAQTSNGDAVVAAGTSLFNATVTYSTAYNGGPCVGMKFPEGTITLGNGVVWTAKQGFILTYGTPTGGVTGERALVLDGATWNNPAGVFVCGANTTSSTVNDGTVLPTTIELKNGATLNLTTQNQTIRVGASFNGNHSPINAAGILKVTDSTVIMNGGQMHLNDVDTSKGGNQNCYGLIYFDNSTLTFNGNYNNRPSLLTSNRDSAFAAHSYAEIVLKDTTVTLWNVNAMALPYTGTLTDQLPDGYTGILRLDGSTLIPRGARTDFIYNSKKADTPSVKLANNNSVIDTAYDVTVPAVAFGDAGWTKKGSGTLTLSGANTYTGATRVEAGALLVSGSIAGGIETAGGTFETGASGTYPSLLMDGGTATFTGASPCTFDAVKVGPGGGTIGVPVKGFVFNGVTGAENLSALSLSANPAGWGTGEVMYSDSADFLAWAAGQLGEILPSGFSASVSGNAVVVDSAVAVKTTTWTGLGEDALWSNDANWDEGAPATADTVVLDGTVNTATELAASIAPMSVSFAETAGEFTVSGLGTLSVTAAVSNNSENAQSFGVPVAFAGASGEIHAVGDIAFAGGVSGVSLLKTGPGTVAFGSSYTGKLDIEEGGVALANEEYALAEGAGDLVIGGTLDLGGGTLALSQADSNDFIIKDGATFKNGTFNYSSAMEVSDGTGFSTGLMFHEGTVTVGEGATLNIPGTLFPYGPDAPTADFGARKLLVDGGTAVLNASGGNAHIIGVDRNWEKGATLEVANGGVFRVTSCGGLVIGARNSGTGTSHAAKGELIVRDGGRVEMPCKITLVNANTAPVYGHVAITNGTVRSTHDDGLAGFGYPWTQANSSQCDAGFEVNGPDGVFETPRVAIVAMAGTGAQSGKPTGQVRLTDGGTIRALKNDHKGTVGADTITDFIFNGGANSTKSTYPALELGTGGGAIDSNGFTVTDSAVMFGEGGLTKKGAGTLTLSAANTYTGGTVVEGGSLVVAESGEIAGGPLVVKSGATFSCPPETLTFSSFTLEEGGAIGYPADFDFDSAPGYVVLFDVTGDLAIDEKMADGGKEIFVKQGDGVSHVCYGKRIGTVVMLR
ncbi:MAG: autotransporter-associated beta strand repeat-containing protein [Kiritimatiellae bacterium]|nr:autotransporter-associated beta strand repeat-containing protein [Kiritimatiellia bacterium]